MKHVYMFLNDLFHLPTGQRLEEAIGRCNPISMIAEKVKDEHF